MQSRRTLITLAGGLMAAALVAGAARAADPIRFAVTDVEGLEDLARDFGPFRDELEKLTGLKVQFFPVNGRTAAVEAMNAKQVDFVLTGPAEYVVFKARTEAKPIVAWQRVDYFSSLLVLANGPIKDVADLKGKKISFHEIGSTSRHLGPGQLLADRGLVYGRDYEPVFVKVNVGIEALERGDLAALGVGRQDIERMRQAKPGLALKVIARTGDLPDDVMIAAPFVDKATVEKVQDAFVKHGDDLLKSVVSTKENRKYLGGHFLATVTDSDYDSVRKMYRAVGVTAFDKFITP